MDIQPLISALLNEKKQTGGVVETSPEAWKYLTQLDNYYWTKSEEIIINRIRNNPESLVFTKYDRLIIDAGVIDWRLVNGDNDFRIELLRELYSEGPKNYNYLSVWLARRYMDFLLSEQLKGEEATTISDKVIQDAQQLRSKLYQKLKPFLKNIRGFPQPTIELFINGKIDSAIDYLDIQIRASKAPDQKLLEQRNTLAEIKRSIILQAKESAITRDDYRLFEQMSEIEYAISSRLKSIPLFHKEKKESTITISEREDFIKAELKLVRSLLKLGITGSGLTKTHSVLTSNKKRITKNDVVRIHEVVKTLDPGLPASVNILIAPYVGMGFYEWDRDTLFVPLIPTRSVEEAIVSAFANYKIMYDTLKNQAMLKKGYEEKFTGKNFRTNFIEDYKAWILGVSRGIRGAIDQEGFDFFKQYIGPSPNNLFAPAELYRLSEKERDNIINQCQQRISNGEATYYDYYKAAVMYYQIPNIPVALEYLAQAVKLNPTDPRTLLAIGYLCLKMNILDKAKEALNECVDMGANTIWQVYAQIYLQQL